MRTLYIDNEGRHSVPPVLTVIAVSNLLRELIPALSEEPVDYTPGSRAAHIASLIEVEIGAEFGPSTPLPMDPRCSGFVRNCWPILQTVARWMHGRRRRGIATHLGTPI